MRPFTEQEKDIIRSMARNSLRVKRVATELSFNCGTIYYHICKIKQVYGLDAKTFYGLTELLNLVAQDEVRAEAASEVLH